MDSIISNKSSTKKEARSPPALLPSLVVRIDSGTMIVPSKVREAYRETFKKVHHKNLKRLNESYMVIQKDTNGNCWNNKKSDIEFYPDTTLEQHTNYVERQMWHEEYKKRGER